MTDDVSTTPFFKSSINVLSLLLPFLFSETIYWLHQVWRERKIEHDGFTHNHMHTFTFQLLLSYTVNVKVLVVLIHSVVLGGGDDRTHPPVHLSP